MLRNLMALGLLSISFQSIGGELLKDEAIPSRLRTWKNKPSYNFTTLRSSSSNDAMPSCEMSRAHRKP